MAAAWTSNCIYVTEFGGPEVLKSGVTEVAAPGAGQVIVRYNAIGVNFADTYQRSGQFHSDGFAVPFIPGINGVGKVVALGPGVDSLGVGDRVTHVGGPGSYTEYRALPADRLIRLPDDLDDDCIAASYARGLTCHYLLKRLYRVNENDVILVHAAAGGLGQLLVRWAKHLGATVIGTVGSQTKAELIRNIGCDYPIVYTEENFVARVLEITGGAGVPVVYDSVGASTFMMSLECLAPMGFAINYGTASGQVPPLPLQTLHSKSLSVCRPTLRNWIAKRHDLETSSHEFFDLMRRGVLSIDVACTLKLNEAARAHALLESRAVAGAMVLHT